MTKKQVQAWLEWAKRECKKCGGRPDGFINCLTCSLKEKKDKLEIGSRVI